MQLQRTSLTLPESLISRLQSASRQAHLSMSALVADLLDHALAIQTHMGLPPRYGELNRLRGIGPSGVTDASTTIDDVLYGDGPKAAWHGHDRTG